MRGPTALQVGLASAKGAPGVTTLALTLGLVWPSPVVVGELDPAGGDLAARLPLATSGGLAKLATGRHTVTWDALAEQLQRVTAACSLLIGPANAVLSRAAVGVLAAGLPAEARSAGVAGLWDLGRLDAGSPAWAAAAECDLVAVVTRPTAGDVAHAVSLLDQLAANGCQVGLVVASPRRRRRAHHEDSIGEAVADWVRAPVTMLGRLPNDALGVSMAERIMARWAGRCPLGAATRQVMEQLLLAGENDGREACTAVLPDPAATFPSRREEPVGERRR